MLASDQMQNNSPTVIGLLLIDGFALMSYASVIEPFRAANALAGRELYRWVHISPDGLPVRASNGATILSDQRVGDSVAFEIVFAFAAGDPAAFSDSATFAWLRRLAVANVRLAGVSGGPFLLARAGLLEGYRSTIHWDHQTAFLEAFPTLSVEPGLYVIDRGRITCAGGTAGLDLAVELIEREQGHALAVRVADWFIRTEHRAADKPQRLSLRERYAVTDNRLLKVLARMEAALEELHSRAELAELAAVSVRQLERLFSRHLGETVNERYLKIRLAKADELVRTTSMSVTAIGIACGFQSSAHFSRAFRTQFAHSPGRLRALVRDRDSLRSKAAVPQ